jgi:pimeloyl-ACP methyl ester carboxylesterase
VVALPKARIRALHARNGYDVVTVVLPGFNQDGAVLLPVLAPGTLGSDMLSYELPRWGFDQPDVVRKLSAITDYRRVIVYAESAGALDLAELLRAYPDLVIDHLVLNAGVSGWRDLNAGAWLKITKFVPGWIVPTAVLRANQRKAVANSPAFDPDVNQTTGRAAQQNSLNISGRQVIAELRRMVNTPSARAEELTGRVRHLTYMGAPDEGSELAERDPFVKLRQARDGWETAVSLEAKLITPPSWTGLHTPTPEKPGPIIATLRHAIAAADQR